MFSPNGSHEITVNAVNPEWPIVGTISLKNLDRTLHYLTDYIFGCDLKVLHIFISHLILVLAKYIYAVI